MESELVEIYRARNGVEAALLRDRLGELGITAFVTNDNLNAGKIDLLGFPTDPAVLVHAADAQVARQIAEAFEDGLGQPVSAEGQLEETSDWPLCPACGKRRMTSCPACQCAGTDFPPGDLPPPEAGDAAPVAAPAPILICPRCDEPFAPRYLPRCEWCAHVFDPEAAAQEPELLADATVTHRVGIVLTILAILAAGLVAYLATLFPYPKP